MFYAVWPVCALVKYIVINICFEFEEKNTLYFLNYKGFSECMYEMWDSLHPRKLRATVLSVDMILRDMIYCLIVMTTLHMTLYNSDSQPVSNVPICSIFENFEKLKI